MLQRIEPPFKRWGIMIIIQKYQRYMSWTCPTTLVRSTLIIASLAVSGHQRDIKDKKCFIWKETEKIFIKVKWGVILRFKDLQLQQKAGLIVVGLVFVLLEWNGMGFYVALSKGKTSQARWDAGLNGITWVQEHCLYAQAQNSTGLKHTKSLPLLLSPGLWKIIIGLSTLGCLKT